MELPEDDFPTHEFTLNERPTDPSPPPEAYESEPPDNSRCPRCQDDNSEHLFDSTYYCFACGDRFQASPGAFAPASSALKVVDGQLRPATLHESAKRPFYDYGKDTGPRLRVKGLVDPPKPPPAPDENGWRERHAAYVKAKAEHDDATIAKLFEKPLDELHTVSEAPLPCPPLDWDELEPALVAELKEWGKAHGFRPATIGLQVFFDGSCAVRIHAPDGVFEWRVTRKSVGSIWRESAGAPRAAASKIVGEGSEAFALAKRREIITVPEPKL